MQTITANMLVYDVARQWPQTMKVFARYGLDLCCGGMHPLEFVAKKHNLDLNRILAELNSAVEETTHAG
jgi:iron-sulfur cluster repair protein YtfE (RIC family)